MSDLERCKKLMEFTGNPYRAGQLVNEEFKRMGLEYRLDRAATQKIVRGESGAMTVALVAYILSQLDEKGKIGESD